LSPKKSVTEVSPLQRELLLAAKEARRSAYAPYSKFAVGAAVRTHDGRIYTGSNVENASYGLSMCAERVALFKAISDGNRDISHIAVFVEGPRPSPPCGACRQVIAEFAENIDILLAAANGEIEHAKLSTLFPLPFRLAAADQTKAATSRGSSIRERKRNNVDPDA
jgi:cytidine deaminase